jgi:hypothetical protein
MVRVFFTTDTEAHPASANWAARGLAPEIRRDIDGVTPEGEFGALYQAEMLKSFGLKGVFFVEALFSYFAGIEPLQKIVSGIQARGHEVGLHLHPEWLRRAPTVSVLPGKEGSMMRLFSEDDQNILIEKGIEQLQKVGVEKVCSFRAGGYAANFATLRALARNGVPYDSSHNFCLMGTRCDMPTEEPLLQPRRIEEVYEFPVSYFSDWPGHYRHAELCACSFGELHAALLRACRENWYSFVIVSHSFELIKRVDRNGEPAGIADKTVMRRFRKLCEFLAENRDKFQTATFSELNDTTIPSGGRFKPLLGFFPHTVWRFAEQARRRVL